MIEEQERRASPRRAILLVIGAMTCFSFQDMVVKVIASHSSVWQTQVLRSLLVLLLAFFVFRVIQRATFTFGLGWRWPLLRAAALSLSFVLFYISFPFLPLSAAAATLFTAPLMITLLSGLVLGEALGWRRLAAVGLGFVGVLLIIRPGIEGWSPHALLPLASAACYAGAIILTRWRCRAHSAVTLTLIHNGYHGFVGLVGLLAVSLFAPAPETVAAWPFLLTGWWPLTGLLAGLIAFTAVAHMIGALSITRAYQDAEASQIAPFEYAYLIPLPLFDLLVFKTPPQALTLAGMLLIAIAGAFVAWRDSRPPAPVPAAARRLGGPAPAEESPIPSSGHSQGGDGFGQVVEDQADAPAGLQFTVRGQPDRDWEPR